QKQLNSDFASKKFLSFRDVIEFNCDADAGNLDPNITRILGATIDRKLHGQTNKESIAYLYFNFFTNKKETKIYNTTKRKWNFEFNGPDSLTRNGSSRSVQINWRIEDATCADAALYMCKINYQDESLDYIVINQDIPARASFKNLRVIVVKQQKKKVSLACIVEGPKGLQLKWFSRYSGGSHNTPVTKGMINVTSAPVPNDECQAWKHRSTLTTIVKGKLDGAKYVCNVVFNNKTEFTKSFTFASHATSASDRLGPLMASLTTLSLIGVFLPPVQHLQRIGWVH
ncbi:hypothetical protein RRG08_017809, partial [Elysia crispata]